MKIQIIEIGSDHIKLVFNDLTSKYGIKEWSITTRPENIIIDESDAQLQIAHKIFYVGDFEDATITTATLLRDKLLEYFKAEVFIHEEVIKTGGHLQIKSIPITLTASTGWFESSTSFPIPINLIRGYWLDSNVSKTDESEFIVAPDTITGALAADVNAGGSTFSVSQTVIDNIDIGFYIKLTDGTNTDDVGRVLAIDSTNNILTMETPLGNTYSAATPTYVKQSVKICPYYVFGGGDVIVRVDGSTTTAYIPANTDIKIRYNNVTGTAKTFILNLEYLY